MGFYTRLKFSEREEVSRCFAEGRSLREAARRIQRHPSTLSRELHRTGYSKLTYRASKLVQSSRERYNHRHRARCFLKIERHPVLAERIREGLRQYWSPQQIARHLKKAYPGNKTMQLSHETIYQYLYVLGRGELKQELKRYLRRQRPYRRKRLSVQTNPRGPIAEMISIEERPAEVADRSVPGHWEGDLLMGPGHRSAIGTLVERQTRLVLLVPLKKKDAVSVREAFAQTIQRLPGQLAKSLTYDQGSEMADHKRFTLQTRMRVYFCHPHSPWERGTCENTNGLLRQFFPKGRDLSKVSLQEIRRVEKLMNGRPRKVLDWDSPSEVFERVVLR